MGILVVIMKVKITFYASLKEKTGNHLWELDVPDGIRCSELMGLLGDKFPEAKATLERSALSSGDIYLQPDDIIQPDASISVLPPVSGG